MPQAHLYAQWREAVGPLRLDLTEARVSNGVVHVGDHVRELPASHHIQPCACTLCRDRPDAERVVRVQAIGSREGTVYLLLPGAYECPALEVERVDLTPLERRAHTTNSNQS
jgi:hypothetical protein